VDGHAERAGPPSHRAADPAHADYAEGLAGEAPAELVGRPPAAPPAGAQVALALAQPPRADQDQSHHQIGRILGQDVGRVGDRDAARLGRGQIDIVGAGAEISDQPKPIACLGDQPGVDPVANGGGKHVAAAHRLPQAGAVERRVGEVELRVEPRRQRPPRHCRGACG
jgi:hypothetical protein